MAFVACISFYNKSIGSDIYGVNYDFLENIDIQNLYNAEDEFLKNCERIPYTDNYKCASDNSYYSYDIPNGFLNEIVFIEINGLVIGDGGKVDEKSSVADKLYVLRKYGDKIRIESKYKQSNTKINYTYQLKDGTFKNGEIYNAYVFDEGIRRTKKNITNAWKFNKNFSVIHFLDKYPIQALPPVKNDSSLLTFLPPIPTEFVVKLTIIPKYSKGNIKFSLVINEEFPIFFDVKDDVVEINTFQKISKKIKLLKGKINIELTKNLNLIELKLPDSSSPDTFKAFENINYRRWSTLSVGIRKHSDPFLFSYIEICRK